MGETIGLVANLQSTRRGWRGTRLIVDAIALREQVANWYSIGPQAAIALSQGHRFIDSRLARRMVTIRRRDGTHLTCQVRECAAYYACFIRKDYDWLEVPWERARTIVDVGANVGASTLWLLLRCPNAGKALAIEPDPLACGSLRNNVADNPQLAGVRVVEAALGGHPGKQGFESAGFSMQSHLVTQSSYLVDVLPLEKLIEMAGGFVDILKLDCEGCEYSLLDCDHELRRVGAIVGEYHKFAGDWPTLRQHLIHHGFAVGENGASLFWATRD